MLDDLDSMMQVEFPITTTITITIKGVELMNHVLGEWRLKSLTLTPLTPSNLQTKLAFSRKPVNNLGFIFFMNERLGYCAFLISSTTSYYSTCISGFVCNSQFPNCSFAFPFQFVGDGTLTPAAVDKGHPHSPLIPSASVLPSFLCGLFSSIIHLNPRWWWTGLLLRLTRGSSSDARC